MVELQLITKVSTSAINVRVKVRVIGETKLIISIHTNREPLKTLTKGVLIKDIRFFTLLSKTEFNHCINGFIIENVGKV